MMMGQPEAILILAVILAAAAVAAAMGFGLIPPPGASTLIRIRNGVLRVRGEPLHARTREHLTDIVQGAVQAGFIAITRQNRVVFSRSIPPALRQRLRNVLLNR